ncbi:flagellar hook-basal body complex FliE family protein [[Clostridium] sordellii ATCC 9714]|nr:flagellar hook-basal body complex FliE family protein [[Clostridium] sordellii ATCC 9714] [Paeniclostridium sordellii ATCC 9714]
MHDVMVSAQEAQMSMQLMIEVRNKVYEAYQDLNRVQL